MSRDTFISAQCAVNPKRLGHMSVIAVPTKVFSLLSCFCVDFLIFGFFFFQVTEETSQMVESVGYNVTLRGVVNVKGKGDLTTYFVNTEHSSPPF